MRRGGKRANENRGQVLRNYKADGNGLVPVKESDLGITLVTLP